MAQEAEMATVDAPEDNTELKKRAGGQMELSPLSSYRQDKRKRNAPLKRAASSQVLEPPPLSAPSLSRCNMSEMNVSSLRSICKPTLPTVYSSRHPDLNVITPETVAKVLRGEFKHKLSGFELLDCRFPFEFEGGSLHGASSLCDPDSMEAQLLSSPLQNCTSTALIFFCEFSANRAPKMLRHVRNVDRSLHANTYPELYYPELYLIDGGYKNCFETLQHICAPPVQYVRMDDERFAEACRTEFAAWRRRWKPHKTVGNCAAKCQNAPMHGVARSLSQSAIHSLSRSATVFPGTASQQSGRALLSTGVRSLFDEL